MTGAARLSNVPARPRKASARVATRTGDGGETSLFGKGRVRKTDPRVEALGDLDETQRARLLQIAEMCPVHRTLTGKIDIRTTLA